MKCTHITSPWYANDVPLTASSYLYCEVGNCYGSCRLRASFSVCVFFFYLLLFSSFFFLLSILRFLLSHTLQTIWNSRWKTEKTWYRGSARRDRRMRPELRSISWHQRRGEPVRRRNAGYVYLLRLVLRMWTMFVRADIFVTLPLESKLSSQYYTGWDVPRARMAQKASPAGNLSHATLSLCYLFTLLLVRPFGDGGFSFWL